MAAATPQLTHDVHKAMHCACTKAGSVSNTAALLFDSRLLSHCSRNLKHAVILGLLQRAFMWHWSLQQLHPATFSPPLGQVLGCNQPVLVCPLPQVVCNGDDC
jgi:hypothetical protein